MHKSSRFSQFKVLALAATLAAIPLVTNAAGLGRITVLSALGQPLRAQLEVTASRDELNSLTAKLASADAFRVAGIDYVPALSALNFSREVKESNGKRYIEINTDRPLNEPFVDMLVELSWASGRLVREYTFLLDPPELTQKTAPAVVTVPLAGSPLATDQVKRDQPIYITGPGESMAAKQEQRSGIEGGAEPTALKRAPALAAAPKLNDSNRLVKTGDTLGKIAAESLPDGVSLDQMLVALFRNNADAFDGNMNRLRAGKILTIPDIKAGREVDLAEARKEVRAQAADFNAYRQKLAGLASAAPAKADVPSQAVAGKLAPKLEEKLPPATGKDKLAVSRTESAKDANGKPLQGRISALEEDIVARDRALRDASGRIAELEKNLTDLKKLAELKSQAGAAMQKQAEAKPAVVPGVAVASPPVSAKADGAPPPAVDTKAVTPPAPVPATALAQTDPPKPKKAAAPPPPEPEPTFLEENGPLVFGGSAILALLLGYLGFSAYRRKKSVDEAPSQEPVTQASLSENSVFSEVGTTTGDTGSIPASEYSVSETVAGSGTEAMDPIVEADTYLAFGRDAQAEEILLDALRNDPARHAVHVKLLEIYSARRSALQFNTLAKDLYEQTGGNGPEWERVVSMGLILDAGNSLYQRSKANAPANDTPPIDPDATMVFTAPPAMENLPAAKAEEINKTENVSGEATAIDFDLDLGGGEDPAQGMTSGSAAPVLAVTQDSGLDFDLDLGQPDATPLPSDDPVKDSATGMSIDFPLDEVQAVAVEIEPSSTEAMALDIDFDLAVPGPSTEATVAVDLAIMNAANEMESPTKVDSSTELELPSVDANIGGGSVTEPEVLSPELSSVVASSVAESDSSAIDFDFDLGDAPAVAMQTPQAEPAIRPVDLSAIDLELNAAGSAPSAVGVANEAVADNPEAATKLELALAYEEMGDRDGARELLQEVLTEGSVIQQAAAQSRLDQLG